MRSYSPSPSSSGSPSPSWPDGSFAINYEDDYGDEYYDETPWYKRWITKLINFLNKLMENGIKDAEVVATSPLPKKIEVKDEDTLTFPQAIEAIIDGKKATRKEWEDTESYGIMKDGFLIIHRDGKDFQWLVSESDMVAKDYIIIN